MSVSFNEDYTKGILKYAKIVSEFRRGTVIYAGAPTMAACLWLEPLGLWLKPVQLR